MEFNQLQLILPEKKKKDLRIERMHMILFKFEKHVILILIFS